VKNTFQTRSIFQELVTWTRTDGSVALQALPPPLALELLAASVGLPEPPTQPQPQPPQSQSQLSARNLKGDRLSCATFVVFLCIAAVQCFPHDMEDLRAQHLLQWLLKSGGGSRQ
jgi:hypothetical protein